MIHGNLAVEILKLRDMGKSVFIVTHDLEFILSCCGHVVRLENERQMRIIS